MPTFRHFVTVGMGAAITLWVVPKAIAISLVEPGASKELPSLHPLRHNLVLGEEQQPPVVVTQEQLIASVKEETDAAGKEEDAKTSGASARKRSDTDTSPGNLSSSPPVTLALQTVPNKRVVNPVRQVSTNRQKKGESQSLNEERRGDTGSIKPVRGLDAATLMLTPDAPIDRSGQARASTGEFPASGGSVSHKPAQDNENNAIPVPGEVAVSATALAHQTVEQSSTSAVPSVDRATVAQSSRPNSGNSAPESLNPTPDPLLFPTQSQEVQIRNAQAITLQQALELARRNNRNLEAAQLTLERNQSALQEALAAEFPTLGVTATFSRDESASQRIRNNAQANNPFFSANSIISESFNGALQANYDLFTAGLRPAQIRQAEQQVRFQQLEVERLSEQLRLDVSNAYYAVQEADAQVDIFQAAVRAASQSLRDAQLLERAGLGTRFDVLQAEVDLASSQQDLTRALSQQRVSRRQIAQLLSVPQTADLAAADPIAVAGAWPLSLEQSIVLAYKNRAELEQFLVQRDIGEQQRRIALASIRPQAGLSASYNILGIMNDNQGPAGGLSLGATLRWNFFDGGAARSRAEQARKNIAIAETRFAGQRDQVRLEVEQAFFNLNANAQNIETATLALQRAEESLRLARLRFQAGVGTQTDVLNQQTALTRARFNQLSAILEYNRALAALQRATSNLPNSNLSNLP